LRKVDVPNGIAMPNESYDRDRVPRPVSCFSSTIEAGGPFGGLIKESNGVRCATGRMPGRLTLLWPADKSALLTKDINHLNKKGQT